MVLFSCHCFSICATLYHQHLHSLRGCFFLITQGSPKCTLRQVPRQRSLQRCLWLLNVSKDCLPSARLILGRVLAVQEARLILGRVLAVQKARLILGPVLAVQKARLILGPVLAVQKARSLTTMVPTLTAARLEKLDAIASQAPLAPNPPRENLDLIVSLHLPTPSRRHMQTKRLLPLPTPRVLLLPTVLHKV